MKVKNLNVYSDDSATLERLAGEYTFIGFDIERGPGHLTVLALPKESLRKTREEQKAARRREENED